MLGGMKMLTLLAATAGVLGLGSSSVLAQEKRPNLILLVTDDHPHDAMGVAGHPVLQTPHMDGLARDGVRFTRAFVTTPICAASRASFFTGMYERAHGYTFGQPGLGKDVVAQTYPVLLREAGYRVGFVGKFGVKVVAGSREAMFDDFTGGTAPYFRKKNGARHMTEVNTKSAIDFVSKEDKRPFCLSLSFNAPHAEDSNPLQYVWPNDCDELYGDADVGVPACSEPAFFEALPDFLKTGLNRERWHWRFDSEEKHERMVKGYWRMLSGVDKAIGRLVKRLDELGIRDNTVIILMGDNGYFLGERGYAGKWTMHDRSTRVPLIVCDPRRAELRGEVHEGFTLNVDVAPTLLELAGVKAPESMQGESLVSLLADGKARLREEVFTEHLWKMDRIPRTEGLRTDGWKFIRYPDHEEFEELYDLRADPEERHNLAGAEEHAERLAAMRARCLKAAQGAQR